jgi:hypothetical protein
VGRDGGHKTVQAAARLDLGKADDGDVSIARGHRALPNGGHGGLKQYDGCE